MPPKTRLQSPWHSWLNIWAPSRPAALPNSAKGGIRFEGVGFAYLTRASDAVVHGLEFEVRPSARVAVVGPSGTGKSTLLLQLLLRFYDAAAGRILLDGIDIATLDPADLRRQFALAPQDPVIFSGTSARTSASPGRRPRSTK